MAQQLKLLGRNGVKEIVSLGLLQTGLRVFGSCCLLIRHECAECQACEGSLAWMLYWNNVQFRLDTLKPSYLQTVSIIEAAAKSTVLQVSMLARASSVKRLGIKHLSAQPHAPSSPKLMSNRRTKSHWWRSKASHTCSSSWKIGEQLAREKWCLCHRHQRLQTLQ